MTIIENCTHECEEYKSLFAFAFSLSSEGERKMTSFLSTWICCALITKVFLWKLIVLLSISFQEFYYFIFFISECDSSNEFECHDGNCILLSDKCNGVVDCHEGEDEDNCSGKLTWNHIAHTCWQFIQKLNFICDDDEI